MFETNTERELVKPGGKCCEACGEPANAFPHSARFFTALPALVSVSPIKHLIRQETDRERWGGFRRHLQRRAPLGATLPGFGGRPTCIRNRSYHGMTKAWSAVKPRALNRFG